MLLTTGRLASQWHTRTKQAPCPNPAQPRRAHDSFPGLAVSLRIYS
jgi:hypothetical protein